MTFPLVTLCSTAKCMRGSHAGSHELKKDELKKDKKGLRNGGGLKKEKRVERKDEETFK